MKKNNVFKNITQPVIAGVAEGNFNDGDMMKVTFGLSGNLVFSKAEVTAG
jgi:hypothetical protein